jgi:hypothetical protein
MPQTVTISRSLAVIYLISLFALSRAQILDPVLTFGDGHVGCDPRECSRELGSFQSAASSSCSAMTR